MQTAKEHKGRFVLKIIIAVIFVVFAVTTFLGCELVINVLSLVMSALVSLLIFISLSTAGKYERTGLCFFLGALVWALGDLFWVVDAHVIQNSELLEDITDNLYLVSDYVILLAAIVYARDLFKKSDYQKIAVNAFFVAILTSLIGYSFAVRFQRFDGVSVELIEILLYCFVSVFSIMLAFIILSRTGVKGHNKAFYTIFIVVVAFSVIETRYSYMMIIDEDPESIYIDILYSFFLVLYSYSWARPDIKDTVVTPKDRRSKREAYVVWINALIMLALAITLFLLRFFDTDMMLGMIIASFGYIIMCKTVQANELSEELLERQKNETERLERMVAEKVKELQKVNNHLEYISNTDVLTGLYNRRYGLDYLETLVKDGDNYPIALYSLDLNHFKPINDNFGHDMGDVVLREVGRRLNDLGQDRCTAVRVGGDEFLVIFRNATNELAVRGVADIICKAMDEPIEAEIQAEDGSVQSHTFEISASIGIAGIPGDTENIDDLYKMADDALYTVKHTSEKSSYLMHNEIETFKKDKDI